MLRQPMSADRSPSMPPVDVFEAIHTARMLRVLKPDPVPDVLIQRILEAAICAPSAGNAQTWCFLAVTDGTQRAQLGDAYRRASVSVRDLYVAQGRPAHMDDAEFQRMLRSGLHLHEHMGDAPLILLPCLRIDTRTLPDSIPTETQALMRATFAHVAAASVYPAVQNVILACRALGLGTCLTTNHLLVEDDVRKIVGLSDDYRVYAMMPIGWPVGRYGPVRRKPLSELACRDRFGTPWTASR
jgi:nitroreductase